LTLLAQRCGRRPEWLKSWQVFEEPDQIGLRWEYSGAF
jgi:hypothetical protein